MFQTFVRKIKLVFTDPMLVKRILFLLAAFALFRLLAVIPIPGIDEARLLEFFTNNQFLGFLNVFSGGGLSNLSIVMLGVSPYITASIIVQLLTMMWPRMKEMYHEEGALGRQKITQYTRMLSLPLAVAQAFGFLTLLERQGILTDLPLLAFLTNVAVVTAGSVFLMWLGELVTEFGIGNGVSLIIFAGIAAAIPAKISQVLFTFSPEQLPLYIAFVLAAIAITAGVVFISESERPLPITYAKQVRGGKTYGGVATYLPLRVNQTGVIPIIFAISILLFPQMIFTFLLQAENMRVVDFARQGIELLQNQWLYGGLYFLLVFFFTYFYTAVTFDPVQMSKNLQKSGAFIPGVRPGNQTAEYVGSVLTRLTLIGALFLGMIAVLPIVMQAVTGVQTLAIGGTALLIVVSVVLDLIRKIDAQTAIREYA